MWQITLYLIPLGVLIATILLFIEFERRKNKFSPFTEKFLRNPGYTLQKDLDKEGEPIVFYLMLAVVVPMVYIIKWNQLTQISHIAYIITISLVMIYVVFRLRKTFKNCWAIRLGLEGEIYTGQELNFLMRLGAWVYHDVPYKYGNIDHIVVSTGGVFVVETKAIRKPSGKNSRAEYKVTYKDGVLKFPHAVTSKPINQAICHAKYLSNFIKKDTNVEIDVIPVVALPGWYVDIGKNDNGVMVINPKRGSALSGHVTKEKISENDAQLIAQRIENYARNVVSSSEMGDPDAHKKYDIFINRKEEKNEL